MNIFKTTLDFLSHSLNLDSAKSYGAGACGVGIGMLDHIDPAQLNGWLQLIATALGIVVILVRLAHDIKDFRKK